MDGADFDVYVTPRSTKNKVARKSDNAIGVWVTASPVDGQANDAVCRIIADRLEVRRSAVTIARGSAGRSKRIHVDGITEDELRAKLALI